MSSKRYDIQGVRAWAVVAVVIFHFFPAILPWGYLGVDVFFVLSGFLISLVLESIKFFSQLLLYIHRIPGKSINSSTYLDFYFKRFKRIFPLALLIILINLLIISQKDEQKLIKIGTRSAVYALLFGTNYYTRDEGEDYFEALEQGNDSLTHYWSLSVEVQFYTIAPLLLHLLRVTLSYGREIETTIACQPLPVHPIRLLTYLSSLALCSLVFSLILPSHDAFYSTLSRLCQFLAGSIAFNLGTMSSEHQPLPQNGEDTVEFAKINVLYVIPLAVVSLASIAIFTLGDFTCLLRLFVTFVAASLLLIQLSTPLLCHQYLQLLGDASYALYLIHWPVVCMLKEWNVEETIYLFGAMVSCIALAIAVHLTYEKWYLSLTVRQTFTLVGVLYLFCCSFVLYNSSRPPPQSAPGKFNATEALLRWEPGTSVKYSEAQVRAINKLMDGQLAESLTIPNCTARIDKEKNDRFKFCHFPNGTGPSSFLIIGNSYALSPGKLVLKHFKKHYSSISIRAVPHCEPLIQTKHKMCKDVRLAHRKFVEDLEREMPDVLFISARYENPGVPIVGDVTEDPLYLYMLNKLKSYEKLVKKRVFMLNSFPQLLSPSSVEKMRKANRLTIEGFMPEAIIADDGPMRIRTRELAKNCEKCVLYDIRGMNSNEKGQYMTVDPVSKLRYFEETVHFTSVGLKLIEPVYTHMAKEFDRLWNSTFPENIFELKR